jgi:hypothetical protein
MKFSVALLIIIQLSITACDDEEYLATVLPSGYNVGYMDYVDGMMLVPNESVLVTFEYSNNRLVKRSGGAATYPTVTGIGYFFSQGVYDELEYRDTELIISTWDIQNESRVLKNKVILTFNRLGQLISKTHNDPSFGQINSFYDYRDGLLFKSTTNNSGVNKVSEYFFNKAQNLDSIVTKRFYQSTDIPFNKEVRIFEDFDQAVNPLRKLIVFDETFNRALSKNNYSKLIVKTYQANYEKQLLLVGERYVKWNLKYDINNVPDFSL